jgi:hypothetical protein
MKLNRRSLEIISQKFFKKIFIISAFLVSSSAFSGTAVTDFYYYLAVKPATSSRCQISVPPRINLLFVTNGTPLRAKIPVKVYCDFQSPTTSAVVTLEATLGNGALTNRLLNSTSGDLPYKLCTRNWQNTYTNCNGYHWGTGSAPAPAGQAGPIQFTLTTFRSWVSPPSPWDPGYIVPADGTSVYSAGIYSDSMNIVMTTNP